MRNSSIIIAILLSALTSKQRTPLAVAPNSWTQLTGTGCPGTTTKGLTVISDTEWWIPCRANGVHHTTNGGTSYITENAGLPSPVDVVRVEVTSHGLMLIALGNQAAGGGIYKRVGTSWQRGNTTTPIGIAELPSGDIVLVSSVSGRPRAYKDVQGDLNFVIITPNDIFAGIGGAGGIDVDQLSSRLRISSEGSGVFGSDDGGRTWFPDGAASGGTTNGPGFGHTFAKKTLYFAQDKILRWLSNNNWEIVAHSNGAEGWKYVDTINSYCWSIAADGVLYIGGEHAQFGIYAVTNNESLYTPFMELVPGPPKGVRIYGVAVLPIIQKLLVVVRDGTVWLTAQPVSMGGSHVNPPHPPTNVRVH